MTTDTDGFGAGRGFQLAGAALVTILLSLICGSPGIARAANFTWSGGAGPGTKTWSTGSNWVGGTAPTSGASIGTLTFPKLSSISVSENNLSALSVEHLALDNSHGLNVSGDALTLGSGGLTFSAEEQPPIDSTIISTPLMLSSSQTWSVSAPAETEPQPVTDNVSLMGQLSGESANLTIDLNTFSDLAFGSFFESVGPDDEIGDVTINGTKTVIPLGEGEEVFLSGVQLPVGFNGSDDKTLTVKDAGLSGSGPTGPIDSIEGEVGMAGTNIGAITSTASSVDINGHVAGLVMDERSTLHSLIHAVGSTPGVDYEQLTSGGAVNLGGANLELESYQDEEKRCPAPPVGQVYTLISTTGSLAGGFSNAPNGSTVTAACVATAGGLPSVERVYSYRINENASGPTKTVTATALPAVPVSYSEEPPTITGTPMQGQILSESHAFWSNSPSSYSYQWERCDSGGGCQAIEGATGQTYVLTSSDIGSTIRVRETASNGEGASLPALSAATAVVQAVPSGVGGGGGGGGSGSSLLGASTGVPGKGTQTFSSPEMAALLGLQLAPSGTAAKIGSLLKHGGLSMSIKTLAAGTLTVDWYELPAGAKLARQAKPKPILIASGRLSVAAVGIGTIRIKLTAAGKRLLKGAKRVKLVGKGTLVPARGPAITATRSFSIRR